MMVGDILFDIQTSSISLSSPSTLSSAWAACKSLWAQWKFLCLHSRACDNLFTFPSRRLVYIVTPKWNFLPSFYSISFSESSKNATRNKYLEKYMQVRFGNTRNFFLNPSIECKWTKQIRHNFFTSDYYKFSVWPHWPIPIQTMICHRRWPFVVQLEVSVSNVWCDGNTMLLKVIKLIPVNAKNTTGIEFSMRNLTTLVASSLQWMLTCSSSFAFQALPAIQATDWPSIRPSI